MSNKEECDSSYRKIGYQNMPLDNNLELWDGNLENKCKKSKNCNNIDQIMLKRCRNICSENDSDKDCQDKKLISFSRVNALDQNINPEMIKCLNIDNTPESYLKMIKTKLFGNDCFFSIEVEKNTNNLKSSLILKDKRSKKKLYNKIINLSKKRISPTNLKLIAEKQQAIDEYTEYYINNYAYQYVTEQVKNNNYIKIPIKEIPCALLRELRSVDPYFQSNLINKNGHIFIPINIYNKYVKDTVEYKKQKIPKNNQKEVLWVRHCESCANLVKLHETIFSEQKFIQRFINTPKCTQLGIKQALTRGINLAKNYPDLNSIQFYCGFLKRTMITSMLAAIGYLSQSQENNLTIYVLPFIGESLNIMEDLFMQKILKRGQNQSSNMTNFDQLLIDIDSMNSFCNKYGINFKLFNVEKMHCLRGKETYSEHNYQDICILGISGEIGINYLLDSMAKYILDQQSIPIIFAHGKIIKKFIKTVNKTKKKLHVKNLELYKVTHNKLNGEILKVKQNKKSEIRTIRSLKRDFLFLENDLTQNGIVNNYLCQK